MVRNTSGRAGLALLTSFLALSTTFVTLGAEQGAPAQGSYVLYLPDVESNGPPSTATPTPGPTATALSSTGIRRTDQAPLAAPVGIEGWGDSTIVLQNLTQGANSFTLDLVPNQSGGVTVRNALGPLSSVTVDMQLLDNVMQAFYAGTVHSTAPLGAVVRTGWSGGGTTAVEAAEPGRNLVIPLLAKTVMSHTTFFFAQNTFVGDEDNLITFEVFDNRTGDPLTSSSFRLQSGESVSWDTAFDLVFDDLGDSYLGSMHIDADEPVAVLAYGEDMGRLGASAFRARPVERAELEQVLPSVRKGADGDTLISIANSNSEAVQVAVTFVGAADSPAGAGQSFAVNLTAAARGTALIDLSSLGRGNVTAPSLPRGFRGSAIVRSSQPVLAVAQENKFAGTRTVGGSAYNGFGPNDLSAHWVAPDLSRQDTQLIIANPGTNPIQVTIAFAEANGSPLRTSTAMIAPGASSSVTTAGLTGASGRVQAVIDAPSEVAVLVRAEESADPAVYWAFPVTGESVEQTVTPTASASSPTPTTDATSTATAAPTGSATLPIGTCSCRIFLPWSTQR